MTDYVRRTSLITTRAKGGLHVAADGHSFISHVAGAAAVVWVQPSRPSGSSTVRRR